MAEADTSTKLPVRNHVYQFHLFDSLRWNFVALRADDVVVVSLGQVGNHVDARYRRQSHFFGT
jgi:hypothetical protein